MDGLRRLMRMNSVSENAMTAHVHAALMAEYANHGRNEMTDLEHLKQYAHGDEFQRDVESAVEEIKRLRAELDALKAQEPVAWDVFVRHNTTRFSIGIQTFSLDYKPEDEPGCTAHEQALWMAGQLKKALSRLAAPQYTPLEVASKEDRAIYDSMARNYSTPQLGDAK